MAVIQDPQTPKPIEQGEAPAAQEPQTQNGEVEKKDSQRKIIGRLSSGQRIIRAQNDIAGLAGNPFQIGQDANHILNVTIDTYSHAPLHSVALYKKTSNGEKEFNGPLAEDAISNEFNSLKKSFPSLDPTRILLDAQFFALTLELDDIIADNRQPDSPIRFLIKSELNKQEKDEQKKMVPKQILVGRYEDHPMPVDSAGAAIGSVFSKQIHVGAIYDLATGGMIPIKNGIIIPLNDKGELLQSAADALDAQLRDLPTLNISRPAKTSDGNHTLQVITPSNNELIDLAIPAVVDPLRSPSGTIRVYNVDMGLEKREALNGQITAGRFEQVGTLTDTDPSTGKTTYTLLLGHTKETGVDRVTGDTVYTTSFTKAFDVKSGNTRLIPSIELPVTTREMVHQADLDRAIQGPTTVTIPALDIPTPQKEADKLASKPSDLTTVDISATQYINGERAFTSDKMAFAYLVDPKTADLKNEPELSRQMQNGSFSQTISVVDSSSSPSTVRILLGNFKESTQIDPLTGESVRILLFTRAFNPENGKTSNLETPIEIPLRGESHIRQADLDGMVEKVRKEVKEYKISRADHPFEALLAKGPSGATQESEIGQLSPTSASVALGKKVASVA